MVTVVALCRLRTGSAPPQTARAVANDFEVPSRENLTVCLSEQDEDSLKIPKQIPNAALEPRERPVIPQEVVRYEVVKVPLAMRALGYVPLAVSETRRLTPECPQGRVLWGPQGQGPQDRVSTT